MAKQKRRVSITSRKHLARIEREQLQKRAISIVAIIVAGLVISLTGFGLIKEGVLDPRRPVVTIGETEVSIAEFQTWARFKRFQLVNQYANYYSFMQSFGDESTQSLIESNLRQIQFQLEPAFLGATVIDEIVGDLLIRQEAERRGITVSDEEVDKYIAENFFMYYPEGTPTPIPTQVTLPTSTLTSLQLTMVPQGPTATPTEEANEEPTLAADGQSDAEGTEAEPTIAFPTPTVYTEEAYQAELEDYLNYIESYANVSENDLRWMIRADLYQKKLMDVITADFETEEEQIWARHILVAEEAEAAKVIERLEAGEDFAELARELSTDTGSGALGGDLGWFGKGVMVAPFEEAAYSLEIGEISEPVESNFGWHIIQVLGREVRPISNERIDQIRQKTFQDWLAERHDSADVIIADDWREEVPTEPSIPVQMQLP